MSHYPSVSLYAPTFIWRFLLLFIFLFFFSFLLTYLLRDTDVAICRCTFFGHPAETLSPSCITSLFVVAFTHVVFLVTRVDLVVACRSSSC